MKFESVIVTSQCLYTFSIKARALVTSQCQGHKTRRKFRCAASRIYLIIPGPKRTVLVPRYQVSA